MRIAKLPSRTVGTLSAARRGRRLHSFRIQLCANLRLHYGALIPNRWFGGEKNHGGCDIVAIGSAGHVWRNTWKHRSAADGVPCRMRVDRALRDGVSTKPSP